jgi:hypothetical protein
VTQKAAPTPAKTKAKKKASSTGGYLGFRNAFPRVCNMSETSVATVVGDLVAQLAIKGEAFKLERTLSFALWGAILSVLVAPYLKWLNSFKLAKSSPRLDSFLKALLNQFISTPTLTVLFIAYFLTIAERGVASMSAYTAAIEAAFVSRYVAMAAYWLVVDSCNLLLVPPKFQLLSGSVCGCVWSIISSMMMD